MQYSALALAALMGVASAQQVTVVQVGMNGTQTFSPNNIRVAQGDMVQFQFMGGNHTATQSNFANPCVPINMINSSVQGFHSGFVPAAASQSMGMIPTYTVQINNTMPLWVYCAQGKHCEGGMSMVINVAETGPNTLEAYKAAAGNATTMVPGGESGTANGGSSGTTTGGAGSSTDPATAAGHILSAPGSLSLLAAIGGLFFL